MTGRLLLLLIALPGAAAAVPLDVFVSVAPQAWLVGTVGGDRVRVEVLVPAGASPASHEPSARQLGRLARARAWFTTGVPMERNLLPRVAANRGPEVIDTAAGLDLIRFSDHDDGHDHGHAHGETDPHVWLSPERMRAQARIVAGALARLDPAGAAEYAAGLAAADSQLAGLADDLAATLAPVRGRDLLTFHPAFGYLCADHGLRQVAIESGGLAPSPRHLAEVMGRAREAGDRTIFIQPQFSSAAAEAVAAELGIDLVTLDPLAADYPGNMRRIADAVREALSDAAAREVRK